MQCVVCAEDRNAVVWPSPAQGSPRAMGTPPAVAVQVALLRVAPGLKLGRDLSLNSQM